MIRALRQRWPRRRWRRLRQIGCLPLVILITGGLLLGLNLLAFRRAPAWISRPRGYLISGRLLLSMGILGSMQVLGSWVLGLVAAGSARHIAAGGQTLRYRLAIVRRRALIPASAVLVLRLALLAVLIVAALYSYTNSFGYRLYWDVANELERAIDISPLMIVVALLMLLLHWLVGPFLRVHYSVALGALAATWSRRADERLSLALSARLGAGLVGVLAALWGVGTILLTVLTIIEPKSSSPDPPALSWETQTVALMIIASIGSALYATGQLVLPELYTRLAQRRLLKLAVHEKNSMPDASNTKSPSSEKAVIR